MIDISSPDAVTLPEILQRITDSGKPAPSLVTVRSWISKGRNGVRLEAVRLSVTWYTTMEAMNQFLAASSRAEQQHRPTPPGPAPLSLRAQWATIQAKKAGL